MSANEIAQWVIDNRYSKGEYQTVSDHEIYHVLVERINQHAEDKARSFAKYLCDQVIEGRTMTKLWNDYIELIPEL